MKQIVMYYSPEVVHKGTKAEIENHYPMGSIS